ncbi:MAG TPA: KaiC associated regulatory domain-containing protein [Thermoplasmatales archaeon]|nr:KaiC associated regulatory domain-containing protein [Thermoplasmatales archaeon]
MEVIKEAVKRIDIDNLAEQVFQESIELLGGLRRIMEYRNLTWLPSLAEAAYIIVLKEELLKTHKDIASELGLTPQTVRNILQAKSEEIEKYIRGEIEKVDEHKAGGIAKLAYEKVRKEKKIMLGEEELKTLGLEWLLDILPRLRKMEYPLDKNRFIEEFRGLEINDESIEEIIDKIQFPVEKPTEVLDQLKNLLT